MLKLTFGIIFYQDAKGIQKLIDSTRRLDPIISNYYLVDGRFTFPSFGTSEEPDGSTDLNQQEINFMKNPKVRLLTKASSEWEKRQVYLEECYHDKPDFLIVMDSDEYIRFDDFDRFLAQIAELKFLSENNAGFLSHNVYDIKFDDIVEHQRNLKPRLWLNPAEMEYTKNLIFRHRQYNYYHTDPTGAQYALKTIEGITIVHHKEFRSEEYEIKNREYQRKLNLLV